MNDTYVRGFMDKCAALGVDAEELVKHAGLWDKIVSGAGRFIAKPYTAVARRLGAAGHAENVANAAGWHDIIGNTRATEDMLRAYAPKLVGSAAELNYSKLNPTTVRMHARNAAGRSYKTIPWEDIPRHIRELLIKDPKAGVQRVYMPAFLAPDAAALYKDLRAPGYTALGLGGAGAVGAGAGYAQHRQNEAERQSLSGRVRSMFS